MIIAGFVVLLAVAPLAVFADPRLAAGLACCLAGLALWRAAALQERERLRRARPADASTVIRQLSAWLVQRRREPIASDLALERGREYATGVQDGAYATLDEVIDRLAETLRLLPPAPGGRRAGSGRAATPARPGAANAVRASRAAKAAKARAATAATARTPRTVAKARGKSPRKHAAKAQPVHQIDPIPPSPQFPEGRPWRPPEARRSADPGTVPTRT